jgi:3-hydroxyisobutyrate dehydrogenase-like beta-hydroxyacid dehydrogenase
MPHQIGILHPGEMGISIAAAAQSNGHTVYWASEDRSAATHERAAQHGLQDAGTVARLCATCDIVISLCPPHAAEAVAGQVLTHDFQGLYLEANAIAPQRTVRLGQALTARGITFVDGCIIGGPAWTPGATHLYLAGPQADEVAACFSTSPLATHVMGLEVGRASALKMCYAAYTKGTTALLSAILAAAEQLDVREALSARWSEDEPGFAEQVEQRVRRSTAKAWRFAGEMEEIAATFRAAGLPGDFHQGAAAIYQRLATFKAAAERPALADVLAALTD